MSNPRKPETVSVRVRETTYEVVKELAEKHGCKAVEIWDLMLEHYLATSRSPAVHTEVELDKDFRPMSEYVKNL